MRYVPNDHRIILAKFASESCILNVYKNKQAFVTFTFKKMSTFPLFIWIKCFQEKPVNLILWWSVKVTKICRNILSI